MEVNDEINSLFELYRKIHGLTARYDGNDRIVAAILAVGIYLKGAGDDNKSE